MLSKPSVATLGRAVETRHGNEVVIWSLANSEDRSFSGQEEMCDAIYKHFADVFGRGRMLDHGQALRDFLEDGPHLFVRVTECCEGSMTAAGLNDVLSDCSGQKSASNKLKRVCFRFLRKGEEPLVRRCIWR